MSERHTPRRMQARAVLPCWKGQKQELAETSACHFICGTIAPMPDRVMFVQLKTGHGTDQGPAWISRVRFNKTWKTAYWHGRTLARGKGMWDANFYDTDTHEEFWLYGPRRDRRDTRYSNIEPTVDDDVRDAYTDFLNGAALPGRERG